MLNLIISATSRFNIWEDHNMKTYIVTLASAIFLSAASIAFAANMTVDVNAIDANGIGKKIGTLRLSDSKQGLRITTQLADLPPGEHGFHVHVNPDCGPGNGTKRPAGRWHGSGGPLRPSQHQQTP